MARSWKTFEKQEANAPQVMDAEARAAWEEAVDAGLIEVWANNLYQVVVSRGAMVPCVPAMADKRPVWLSVYRVEANKLPRDWRDLQRIKNEILGPNIELVELIPAEHRLVDSTNHAHLWGFESEQFLFPFGFDERDVRDQVLSKLVGYAQRGFEFPVGMWHTPPAADRRAVLGDADAEFLLDMIEHGPQEDSDYRRVAEIRAALHLPQPEGARAVD